MSDLKDQLRTTVWLSSTTVGICREEEPIDWTGEDYDNVCDNITSKTLSPQAVRIARREELELMDKFKKFQLSCID